MPLLALAADCVPIAIATTEGPATLAVVHAGWRGLAAGVIDSTVAALGPQPKRRSSGRRSARAVTRSDPKCRPVFDADLTDVASRRLRHSHSKGFQSLISHSNMVTASNL